MIHLYELSNPLILLACPLDDAVYGLTLPTHTKGNLMNVTNDSSPNENEYLAAIAGLHEQTPSRLPEPAVGDFISGKTLGKHWSGHVEFVVEDRVTINVGGGWLTVPLKDITH